MRNFPGFSIEVNNDTDFYDPMRFNEEALLLTKALIERMGKRVRKNELDSGWDTRTGRDYFYFNYIIWTQRKDPSFIGVYHYRKPEEWKGTRYQVWRWEHDSEPVVDYALGDLHDRIQPAAKSGRLGDLLDTMAEEIRLALSLR